MWPLYGLPYCERGIQEMHSEVTPYRKAMFGWDPLKGLQQLLGETTRYLGEGNGKLDLTALQNTYQLVAQNVQMASEKSKVEESSVPPAF